MKKLFLVLGAATLVACMHEENRQSGATVNEPAGAEVRTNRMDSSMAPRDMNQQPYPGTSGLNPQRGSGSASNSSLEGSAQNPNQNSGTSTSPNYNSSNP